MVNFPGFVFSKLSLLQLASRGFVLSNGIKHSYIAAIRKMLNNFVWALLVRYQLWLPNIIIFVYNLSMRVRSRIICIIGSLE
jgi:hypothetical protein